jgi:hypothetical protein
MIVKFSVILIVVALGVPALGLAQDTVDYRVLATNRTSTMQKEMQEAGQAGFRFTSVMGGETSFGGKEVVVLMHKRDGGAQRFDYRLLATTRTSSMQRELQEAADAGFELVGQTVFESLFGGKEVAAILERDPAAPARPKYEYKLIATKRTSTLQKEMVEAGALGYEALGMTVGETAIGGSELVVITRRPAR